MEESSKSVPFNWIFIVITVVLAILIIISYVLYFELESNTNLGFPLRVQNGKFGVPSEAMQTGGNNLYIANSPNVRVEITNNSSNIEGRTFYIKNNTAGPIRIDPTKLQAYEAGNILTPLRILSGSTAQFLFTGTNQVLRLS